MSELRVKISMSPDEMETDLVPTLPGRGEGLFDGVGDGLRGLELERMVAAPKVTHLELVGV